MLTKFKSFKPWNLEKRPKRMNSAIEMLWRIEDEAEFLNHIMVCNEACFHASNRINLYDVHRWGSENP